VRPDLSKEKAQNHARSKLQVTKTSLRLRALGLWALSFIACIAVGALLALLYQQSTAVRVEHAEAKIAHACDLIRDSYSTKAALGSAPALSDPKLHLDLAAAVNQALAGQNGVEGGIWQTDAGPLAYAFPTYAGTGPKTDLPAAERDHIKALNAQAARDERPITRRSVSQEQNLLLHACPLSSPIPGLTAWTMTRVEAVPDYDRLLIGLSALLGFMVLMSAWLGRVLMLWARYLSDIESAPGGGGAVGAPTITPTGAREPAPVVEARRQARQHHGKAPRQPAALAAQASRVELLAFAILSVIIALALSAAVATLWSPRSVIGGDTVKVAAGAIFAGAYLALAIGKIPGLRIDRAGVALVGASLMVGAGVLTLDEASKAVDFGTIALLLGIMIVVANLRLSGFFALANAVVARHVRRPIVLLATVVIVSGFFSAFLVNDAICLVLSPLVLELSLSLKRKPTPYLLAVAMASNIGSTATITGNPQNIMIGSFSGVPYFQFTLALAPVALAGLVLTVLLLALAYRAEFLVADRIAAVSPVVRVQKALLARALLATGTMVALFFAGQPPAKATIVIGGLLLLTGRIKSERIYREIDWSLLLMFVGLFIIVAGAQHALLTPDILAAAGRLHLDQIPMLSIVTAVLSNLVSNVPAVLVLRPFIDELHNRDTAWLVVAMASTLAGNFTVLGSIANLIVVQKAAARGVTISFWEYFRVGAPLTLTTLAVGTLWLSL
jgi:Na+/H+ antiporter NhaD/arsenite permease-like protein